MVILGAKVHEGPWKLPMSQNCNLSYLLVGRQPYRTMNLTPSVSHLNTGNPAGFSTEQNKSSASSRGLAQGGKQGVFKTRLPALWRRGTWSCMYAFVMGGRTYLAIKSENATEIYMMGRLPNGQKKSWKLQGKVDQVKVGRFSLSLEVRASLPHLGALGSGLSCSLSGRLVASHL